MNFPAFNDWFLASPDLPSPLQVEQDLKAKFRESIVDRGMARIRKSLPVHYGVNKFLVQGHPNMSDMQDSYLITQDKDTYHYSCSCFANPFGEVRKARICSHVLAVIITRRLGYPLNSATPPLAGLSVPSGPPRDLSLQAAPPPGGSLPAPASLGLPAKFRVFREVQWDAIEQIAASKKKWILFQAPTGVGKSLVAAAVQKILKQKMVYTCTTHALQEQFLRDFPYAVELKGRSNYPTANYPERFPHVNCATCLKGKGDPRCMYCCPPDCYLDPVCLLDEDEIAEANRHNCRRKCPYNVQKKRALAADLAVLNTAFLLNEANYVGGFSKLDFVCLDEADLLEENLMGFIELRISSNWIERLGLQPPDRKTVEAAWLEWAKDEALPKIQGRIKELEHSREIKQARLSELKELDELVRIEGKLKFFISQLEGNSIWVNCTEKDDEDTGPWVFKPVFISGHAKQNLWKHAEQFLLMSATLLSKDQFCKNLGIPPGEAEWVEAPSIFPVKNRPVNFVPAANVTEKTREEEWPKVADTLIRILALHPQDKVLVHTVSYRLARYLLENSGFQKNRMMVYSDSKDKAKQLEVFKQSSKPMVMLAPSMDRGVDLPGDLCRVVVIAKVPYASLGDNQVKRRLYGAKDGRGWYAVNTIRTIIQMAGRGVRSETDWCTTYIIDGQFGRLLKEWKNVFPGWWRQSLQTIPPEKLETWMEGRREVDDVSETWKL